MANETIKIPDLGGVDEVVVLEILVKVGDEVSVDQPLMSLESEKASMDVPCDRVGTVSEILLKPGDKVREGDDCARLTTQAATEAMTEKSAPTKVDSQPSTTTLSQVAVAKQPQPITTTVNPLHPIAQKTSSEYSAEKAYASPTVRRLARQLGIDLQVVPATGPAGRVTQDDLVTVVLARQQVLPNATAAAPSTSWQDPTKFGPCEPKKLGKIKNATAKAMAQSWANVVHVTQFDRVDITELEAYRCEHKDALKAQSIRLTMLAFNIKALAPALKKHPNVNASYQQAEKTRWEKGYYHIGFAVDTPGGLVVPVIQNVDRLSVIAIAKQLADLSQKARAGELTPRDMTGASFTVSSLGGLGGAFFTPIVNQPQSAILGISRAEHQPIWDGKTFNPRLMLPLSLSYDHRVIDGAEAMRFLNDYMAELKTLVQLDLNASSL
jgi:pyruvate dehydrogenase E2 component (dihydrolipoamide acetyltransferase)